MLELYNFASSTCSQKVRLCLAEKAVAFVDRPLDFFAGEHLGREYLQINPNGVVPTLVHDARPVIESSVIVEYLDEMFPDPPLSPPDSYGRAQLRAWLRYIDEVPTPAIRIPSLNMTLVRHFAQMNEAEFQTWAKRSPLRTQFLQRMGRKGFSRQDYDNAIEQLQSAVNRMETALETGPWLLGTRLTLADLCILPIVDRMVDLGLAHSWDEDAPRVSNWYARFRTRESFVATFSPGSRLSDNAVIGNWNMLLKT